MKTFLFVLLGAALFGAVMYFAVTHYPDGAGRGVGFIIGLALFALCAFGPGRLWGKGDRLNSFALPLVLLLGSSPALVNIWLSTLALFLVLLRVKFEEYGSSNYKSPMWYNHPKFSLIPSLTIRRGNEHNTTNFYFDWLFLRVWSLDHAAFEVGIAADTHWGIGVLGIVPYLRWVCCIPCPESVGMWVSKALQRRPKAARSYHSNMAPAVN